MQRSQPSGQSFAPVRTTVYKFAEGRGRFKRPSTSVREVVISSASKPKITDVDEVMEASKGRVPMSGNFTKVADTIEAVLSFRTLYRKGSQASEVSP